jgi:hypothetical protein
MIFSRVYTYTRSMTTLSFWDWVNDMTSETVETEKEARDMLMSRPDLDFAKSSSIVTFPYECIVGLLTDEHTGRGYWDFKLWPTSDVITDIQSITQGLDVKVIVDEKEADGVSSVIMVAAHCSRVALRLSFDPSTLDTETPAGFSYTSFDFAPQHREFLATTPISMGPLMYHDGQVQHV